MVKFNPIDKNFRSEVGGVVKNTPQTFTVLIREDIYVEGVHFSLYPEYHRGFNILMTEQTKKDGYRVFSCTYTFLESGLYTYNFSFYNGNRTQFISKNLLGLGEISDISLTWQVTVSSVKPKDTSWFKGNLIYQIFPDRFNKIGKSEVRDGGVLRNWGDEPNFRPVNGFILNNDFFGGNFEGVIEKINYLKELNIGIVYFNPIFEAESNHKYDTSDFEKIDECFGGEKLFKKMLDKLHEAGIKVILDGVFNHVGENSKYFNKASKYNEVGAYNSKDSKYFEWFTFLDHPNKYDCWWGIKLLPAIKSNCQSYIDYITGDGGVVEKYLKMGVDGFRLDVVDEVSDEFLTALTQKIRKENKNAIVIGEVWEDASNKVAYGKRRNYFTENQLDGVMNYVWKNAIIDFVKNKNSRLLYSEIVDIVNNYPSENLHSNMNILSTHDTKRILTALKGEERRGRTREELEFIKLNEQEKIDGLNLVKMATLLQFTLPGVPSIYYGEEVGMEGYGDPFNRRCFPWGNIDVTYLDWYKKLTAIRAFSALKTGEIKLDDYVEGVIAYCRCDKEKTLYTVINLSEKPYVLTREMTCLLTDRKTKEVKPNDMILAVI